MRWRLGRVALPESPSERNRLVDSKSTQHIGEASRCTGTELLGKFLGDVLLDRVVANFLSLDHVAGDVIERAVTIRQTQLYALGAAPHQAGEHLRCFAQALATTFFHHIDELLMYLTEHDLRVSFVGLVER